MSQRARAKQTRRTPSEPPWFWIAIVAIVVVFVVAVVVSRNSKDEPSGDAGSTAAQETAEVSVSGEPLPVFGDEADDPAVGQQAPVLSGENFDGEPIEIGSSGKPTAVIFVAHWCPHCQAEVPRVKAFIDEGRVPDGIDIVTVATGTSESQANYPPSAWLQREGWQPPVMADSADGTAASAYGLSAYPFFVFLNSDGTVDARTSGEMEMDALADALAALE